MEVERKKKRNMMETKQAKKDAIWTGVPIPCGVRPRGSKHVDEMKWKHGKELEWLRAYSFSCTPLTLCTTYVRTRAGKEGIRQKGQKSEDDEETKSKDDRNGGEWKAI